MKKTQEDADDTSAEDLGIPKKPPTFIEANNPETIGEDWLRVKRALT
jgi:hypothetical protein